MLTPYQNIVAGMPPNTEVVERRAPVEGNADEVFAKALRTAHVDPHGLSKGAGVERSVPIDPKTCTRAEGENAVTAMIRKAHSNGNTWQPFSEVQDPAIDKLLGHVHAGERGEIAVEGGAKVVRISKVL